jgi:hypothetical protein
MEGKEITILRVAGIMAEQNNKYLKKKFGKITMST